MSADSSPPRSLPGTPRPAADPGRQQRIRDLFLRRGATVEQIADLRAADCDLDIERHSFLIRFSATPDADELILGLSPEESADLFSHFSETGTWVKPELHVFSGSDSGTPANSAGMPRAGDSREARPGTSRFDLTQPKASPGKKK